jgi:hypothetical protein
MYLARQVFPENPKILQEAYADATTEPHGYQVLDLTQETMEKFRLRTKIFEAEYPKNIFYIPTANKYIK